MRVSIHLEAINLALGVLQLLILESILLDMKLILLNEVDSLRDLNFLLEDLKLVEFALFSLVIL